MRDPWANENRHVGVPYSSDLRKTRDFYPLSVNLCPTGRLRTVSVVNLLFFLTPEQQQQPHDHQQRADDLAGGQALIQQDISVQRHDGDL